MLLNSRVSRIVGVASSNTCLTNLTVRLKFANVAYLYWCMTLEGYDDVYALNILFSRPQLSLMLCLFVPTEIEIVFTQNT